MKQIAIGHKGTKTQRFTKSSEGKNKAIYHHRDHRGKLQGNSNWFKTIQRIYCFFVPLCGDKSLCSVVLQHDCSVALCEPLCLCAFVPLCPIAIAAHYSISSDMIA